MKISIILLTFLVTTNAKAANYLDKLDVLSTCASQVQKTNAEKTLSFFENFKWWKIKNMTASIHPDYRVWHSSRTFFATLYPLNKVPQLPFKNGQVDRAGFLYDLAMIAYTNDVPKYTIDITRLECLGDDMIILSTYFSGINIYRDSQGKALYQTEIKKVSTRFTTTMKDDFIYRLVIDLPDETTKTMISELAALIKSGVPNVTPGTIPNLKFEDILKDFENKANL